MKLIGLLLVLFSMNANAAPKALGSWTAEVQQENLSYKIIMEFKQDELTTIVTCSDGANEIVNTLSTKITLTDSQFVTLESKTAPMNEHGINCDLSVDADITNYVVEGPSLRIENRGTVSHLMRLY